MCFVAEVDRLVRLLDRQWVKIEPLLPPARPHARPHRLMVEAMIWVLRTGAPWRDLPAGYGPWQSVYTRLRRWAARGVLSSLFAALAVEHDSEGYLIDATIVRAHQDAHGARMRLGSQEIGRSRGGPTTKIHAVVDALGNPVCFALSPGQTHEMKLAHQLLANIANAYVIGDSAYSSLPLTLELEQRGCNVVIASNPTHRRRRIDRHLYRERCLVEHFFQRIKRFRRIATRFDKLSSSFLAFLHLAAALVWLT